ncbi:LRR receptor-like serine/threonine-protein kinase GSO1 [Euphorbia lathyris]|uniref:LRR receptor-like serine/threonine-protein kinase GSO1 n=1 Tax=Euphorbia lathyris TaxID=212925 RepID=UPI003313E105
MNLFLISFLSILSLTSFKLISASCHVDDETGLLAFKSGITHDPSGLLTSWKQGTDCCTWSSISCSDANRVTSLYLIVQPDNPNIFLSGTISPLLSKVQNLDTIYFRNLRNLTGTFPTFLFGLPKLKYVYIEDNMLSGQIPASIGNLTQLVGLSLAGNRFTGSIPSSISELTQLTQLLLGDNLLTGEIPYGISKIKTLNYLSLELNILSGPIPDFFSSFTNLRYLELSHNRFSGEIPASLSTLASKLAFLELGFNKLSGKIPDFLGSFTILDTLDLSWNNLSGTVPKTFGNLTKIFNLDLSHNSLTDPFPAMNVKGIESLDLSYNEFHLQQIPNWVTSSPIIYKLGLAKCGIKMKLDDWKPKQTYFYDYIDLGDNEISGSPIWLVNKTDHLIGFRATGNKLKFDLGKLRFGERLKYLNLGRNSVYGKVPKNITRLNYVDVSYNHLCGELPPNKFTAASFVGNDCLCGSPLAPCKL